MVQATGVRIPAVICLSLDAKLKDGDDLGQVSLY